MTAVRVLQVNTLTPYVRRYLGERHHRGEITRETVTTYRHHLEPFADVFGHRPLDQLGPWVTLRWLETIGHMAPSTRGSRLSTVRRFAGWMVDEDIVTKDFTRRAPKIRRPRHVPRDVGLEEFLAIFAACQTERERAVVLMMYGEGMRCVEVARLQMNDWDTRAEQITATGKFLHQRVLPVHPIVRQALNEYLAVSPISQGPIIRHVVDDTRGMTSSGISSLVQLICARSGIKQRPYDGISAHGLRSGAASDLLDACNDLRVVQEFLGHANLATTSRYLRKVGIAKMREGLELRPWTRPDDEAA